MMSSFLYILIDLIKFMRYNQLRQNITRKWVRILHSAATVFAFMHKSDTCTLVLFRSRARLVFLAQLFLYYILLKEKDFMKKLIFLVVILSLVFTYGCKTNEKPAEVSDNANACLLYTSPSPRDRQKSRMPSSA